SRVQHIKQEILSVDVVHITVICVNPVGRPGIKKDKIHAAIDESRLSLHNGRALDHEGVALAKALLKLLVRNARTLSFWMSNRTSGCVVAPRGRMSFVSSLSGGLFLVAMLHLFFLLFLLLLLLCFLRFLLFLRRLG